MEGQAGATCQLRHPPLLAEQMVQTKVQDQQADEGPASVPAAFFLEMHLKCVEPPLPQATEGLAEERREG